MASLTDSASGLYIRAVIVTTHVPAVLDSRVLYGLAAHADVVSILLVGNPLDPAAEVMVGYGNDRQSVRLSQRYDVVEALLAFGIELFSGRTYASRSDIRSGHPDDPRSTLLALSHQGTYAAHYRLSFSDGSLDEFVDRRYVVDEPGCLAHAHDARRCQLAGQQGLAALGAARYRQ